MFANVRSGEKRNAAKAAMPYARALREAEEVCEVSDFSDSMAVHAARSSTNAAL
jgi:hypothetical protein